MFALLLCTAALTTSDVDQHCREKFGHPGDLGVTPAAEMHFTQDTSYVEASATIGELGIELPSPSSDTKVYGWQNGQLEMHFRSDRLTKYRMNGNWTVYFVPLDESVPHPNAGAHQHGFSNAKQPASDEDRRREFAVFQRSVVEIIEIGSQATPTNLERSDMRALTYHLAKLSQATAANDWKEAERIRDGMKISLQRSHAVAIDTKRRLIVRKRAEDERRHREEMQQRERQHQEQMRQQEAILNGLRAQRGY